MSNQNLIPGTLFQLFNTQYLVLKETRNKPKNLKQFKVLNLNSKKISYYKHIFKLHYSIEPK